MSGWIGVDLDGTLAHYDGWKGVNHIGEPVTEMVERVRKWLEEGRDVRIFTARVSHDGSAQRMIESQHSMIRIMDWCEQHLGRSLPVTCVKDFAMIELWDDRAVQVMANFGRPIGFSTRGLA
jgi:translation initiation factor 2 alpha subunit (eIF-2alpha)